MSERHLRQGNEHLAPLVAAYLLTPPPVQEGLERLVAAMVKLHDDSPRLHRVIFEECPRPAALQEQIDAARRIAVETVETWLGSRNEVSAANVRLSAELVVSIIEGVTHDLVIHPRPGHSPADYASETVAMLTRYLCA